MHIPLPNFLDPDHHGKLQGRVPENIAQYLHLPLGLFRISFVIGTAIFLLFAATRAYILITFGICYFFLALIINIIMLLIMLIAAAASYPYTWLIFQKSIIMLLNLPIAYAYLLLVVALL